MLQEQRGQLEPWTAFLQPQEENLATTHPTTAPQGLLPHRETGNFKVIFIQMGDLDL